MSSVLEEAQTSPVAYNGALRFTMTWMTEKVRHKALSKPFSKRKVSHFAAQVNVSSSRTVQKFRTDKIPIASV